MLNQLERIVKLSSPLILLLLLSGSVQAQSLWLKHDHKPMVSMEILKPKYAENIETNILNMNLYISAYIPVNQHTSIIFELPYTKLDLKDYSHNSGAIGNIYLGVEYDVPENNFAGNFGVRIPTSSESDYNPLSLGIITDSDRLEAFTTKHINFFGSIIHKGKISPEFCIRTGLGPMATVLTESQSYQESELYIRYYTQLWVEQGFFSMAMGLTGLYWLTVEDLDFGERTLHHLGLTSFYKFGNLKPGLILLIPLDKDLTDEKDFTYGLSLTLEFDRNISKKF